MISLRKHIENYQNPRQCAQPASDQDNHQATQQATPQQDPGAPATPETGMPEPLLSEFRAMLVAIGDSAGRAVPNLGVELNRKMAGIQKTLVQPVTTDLLTKTNQQARTELSKWADLALSHHQDNQRELREIVSAIAAAAESVSARDEKYAREIGGLTTSLGAIAEESDLASMRRSIVESTRSLKSCVTRMAEDSKASVQVLTTQVGEYRARLEEAERVSLTDPLTCLANRRAFEKHLEARISACKPFCLIMIDLDEFKGVNDRFGHLAGDDLLKQFASELKSQFTPAEMVGRMGGDEFIVVMAGGIDDTRVRVEGVRKWTLGEYKISTGDRSVKTVLKASIGVAAWDGRETGIAFLARVDQEVYRAKQSGARARVPGSEKQPHSAAPKELEPVESYPVVG
jgi:diguanylate cyclase (GGDEF)-like protein